MSSEKDDILQVGVGEEQQHGPEPVSAGDEVVDGLRQDTTMELKTQEHVEIDERLRPLVVDPINALPEDKRTVCGKVRSGEEIARAIPDTEAFLAEVNLQKNDEILLDFFELTEAGQLVMKDNCPEAYGRDENALQAKIRQTRIIYKGEDGQTRVMTGREFFTVTKKDKNDVPLEMEISEAARQIDPKSILMVRGLPTLKCDNAKYTGEYARMNTGKLERWITTWVDDDSLSDWRARTACWGDKHIFSRVRDSSYQFNGLGSHGVLRVNLNFES